MPHVQIVEPDDGPSHEPGLRNLQVVDDESFRSARSFSLSLEDRLHEVEAEVVELKEKLGDVTAELASLRESGGLLSILSDARHVLERFLPQQRKDHASRPEILLAARWAALTYCTCKSDAEGFSVERWNALRLLEPDAMKAAVHSALAACPNAIGFEAYVARCAESAEAHPDMEMVAHEESNKETLDGQVSVWRSHAKRTILVAWRGTDSIADARLNSRSAWKAPFRSKEDPSNGAVAKGAKGAEQLSRTADDESLSPLFHIGLVKHRLLVGKGFLTQYLGEGLSERVKRHVALCLRANPGYSLLVCGHSLGGALCSLCAYELAKLHTSTPVLAITFGAPRHLNSEFCSVLSRMVNLRIYRIANELDVVTRARLNPAYKVSRRASRRAPLRSMHRATHHRATHRLAGAELR